MQITVQNGKYYRRKTKMLGQAEKFSPASRQLCWRKEEKFAHRVAFFYYLCKCSFY